MPRPPPGEDSRATSKIAKWQPLSDLQPRQLLRRTEDIWKLLAQSATQDDALTLLRKVLEKAEKEWPGSLARFAQQNKVLDEPVDCGRCCNLLGGLSSLPAFQATTKLSNFNRTIQHQIDCLVRKEIESRAEAARLGYPMGEKRWVKAGRPEEALNPGGRPSCVDSPAVIESVRNALDLHSQPSSAVCQKAMPGAL